MAVVVQIKTAQVDIELRLAILKKQFCYFNQPCDDEFYKVFISNRREILAMIFILKLIEFRVKTKHLMQRKLQQKMAHTIDFQNLTVSKQPQFYGGRRKQGNFWAHYRRGYLLLLVTWWGGEKSSTSSCVIIRNSF